MASSSDQKEVSYKDVQGYIHDVSPVKIPANPRSNRYFDFKFQQGQDQMRVVCFNTEKRDQVKEKEECKIPVTETNVSPSKRKYTDQAEYRMNKFSRVYRAKNLSFQWKKPEGCCEMSIKEILDKKSDGDVVTLKAKVLQNLEVSSIYSCDLVLGDNTGAIFITVWEENIDKVNVNDSYCFHLVTVNSFHRKQLNSNRASTISNCDDVATLEKVSDIAKGLASSESVTGSILAISIKRLYTCINFKSKIADIPGQFVLKCSKCALAIKKVDMAASTTSNIVIKDDDGNNIGRFYCPNAVMQSFFSKLSEMQLFSIAKADLAEVSVEMMEKTMLNLKKVKFEVVTKDKLLNKLNMCSSLMPVRPVKFSTEEGWAVYLPLIVLF